MHNLCHPIVELYLPMIGDLVAPSALQSMHKRVAIIPTWPAKIPIENVEGGNPLEATSTRISINGSVYAIFMLIIDTDMPIG